MASEMAVPFLGRLPLDPRIGLLCKILVFTSATVGEGTIFITVFICFFGRTTQKVVGGFSES